MFEAAEVGSECSKQDYEAAVPQLRVDLLKAQFGLRQRDFAMLIHIAGVDREGVEEIYDLLHEWLDARLLDSHAFARPSEEELERPRFWRYWRALPADGRTGIFLGAWTRAALVDRLLDQTDDRGFERRIQDVRAFERDLVADGTLLLKVWLHVPVRVIEKRLRQAKKRPNELHFVESRDKQIVENWDDVRPLAERYLAATSTPEAPWTLVEGTDARHRNLTITTLVRDALQRRLERTPKPAEPIPLRTPPRQKSVLDRVDLSVSLPKKVYREQLGEQQARLFRLALDGRRRGRSAVLVFEGWDAAGKGGAIRRLTRAMSAHDYRVVGIAAPTDEEKAHHYLWRFWRQLPRAGKVLIFDRSWYGRVLVERVEGFATEAEWRRAYDEINDFESQLVEYGIVLQKFWLHIDEDEQLRRFESRRTTGYKEYKITDEDVRNLGKRIHYVQAVDDMVARTSTDVAPWTIVPANDKRYARVAVVRKVCEALERG